jgi:hypothetical protein
MADIVYVFDTKDNCVKPKEENKEIQLGDTDHVKHKELVIKNESGRPIEFKYKTTRGKAPRPDDKDIPIDRAKPFKESTVTIPDKNTRSFTLDLGTSTIPGRLWGRIFPTADGCPHRSHTEWHIDC